MALLLARIQDAQSNFKLTLSNAPAIAGICERLDGMPLALELAAARFALLSPEQVLERLDHRFRFLVGEVAGRDHRHRNLIALLEWSFALLSPAEQKLLAWLGVFVQGWSVEAVIDLAPAFGVAPEEAVDLLTGLAGKSLASIDQSASPPRYRLLESVREFALEQLRKLGDERRARDAHLAYVLRMTEQTRADMLGARMRERIALLGPELGNIDSASEYAAGPGGNAQGALRIAGLLSLYFKAHGETALALRLCNRALAAAPATHNRERAQAELCRGISIFSGSKVAADQPLRAAVTIACEVGDGPRRMPGGIWRSGWPSAANRSRLQNISPPSSGWQRSMTMICCAAWRVWRAVGCTCRETTPRMPLVSCARSGVSAPTRISITLSACISVSHCSGGRTSPGPPLSGNEAMRNAIAVGHLRGIAGSVKGAAIWPSGSARPSRPADS